MEEYDMGFFNMFKKQRKVYEDGVVIEYETLPPNFREPIPNEIGQRDTCGICRFCGDIRKIQPKCTKYGVRYQGIGCLDKTVCDDFGSVLSAEDLLEEAKETRLQNREAAFPLFFKAAEMGSIEAMHIVGQSYLYLHSGAPFDLEKSAYWYKKAAENGRVGSMIMLSQCYLAGAGVPESDAIAKQWLERALAAAEKTKDQRTVEIIKRRLCNLEDEKISMKALYASATELGGIPTSK